LHGKNHRFFKKILPVQKKFVILYSEKREKARHRCAFFSFSGVYQQFYLLLSTLTAGGEFNSVIEDKNKKY